MPTIKERYNPIVMTANATVQITDAQVAGFLCTVSGFLSVSRLTADSALAGLIVNTLPVTAGVYYPMPFFLGANGGSATCSGGAAGTLGV